MKCRILLPCVLSVLSMSALTAQNVSSRTNEFEVDFSDPKKLVYTTIPIINWVSPIPETNYAQEAKYKIEIEIVSDKPLKSITLAIRENDVSATRGMLTMKPDPGQERKMVVEKTLTLMDGENLVEVVAENIDGQRTISHRKIHIGNAGLADAIKLDRTDYALVFATDQYDHRADY